MVYQWKSGYRASIPAQVAGERLAQLSEANGGQVTPAEVVEDARPEDSPLHEAFEWDAETAAEEYRKDQARRLLRNCYVVYSDDDAAGGAPGGHNPSGPCLQYIHVDLSATEPVYVSTARALGEPELREQVIATAIREFEALRRRYEHIEDLAELFAAVDDAAARRRRRRAARDSAAV